MLNILLLLEFSKCNGTIFNSKLKQASLKTNQDLITVEKRANKNKEKIEKL